MQTLKLPLFLLLTTLFPELGYADSAPGRYHFVNFGVALGLAVNGTPSAGLEGGLRFGKFGFFANYYHGENDYKSTVQDDADSIDNIIFNTPSDAKVDKALIAQDLIGAQVRFYPLGGSFFLSGGAGQGKITGNLKMSSVSSSAVVNEKTTIDNSFYSASIGNIWKAGPMDFGFEWIGLTKVASSKSKTTDTNSGTENEAMLKAHNSYGDLLDIRGNKGAINFLILHIGLGI